MNAHRIINLIRFPQFLVTSRDRFECEKMPKHCTQSLNEIQSLKLKRGPVNIQQWNIWNGLWNRNRNRNRNATDVTIIFCEYFGFRLVCFPYCLSVSHIHHHCFMPKRHPKKTFNFGIFNFTHRHKYTLFRTERTKRKHSKKRRKKKK